eukprot:Gb_30727 [translate_table: standard]
MYLGKCAQFWGSLGSFGTKWHSHFAFLRNSNSQTLEQAKVRKRLLLTVVPSFHLKFENSFQSLFGSTALKLLKALALEEDIDTHPSELSKAFVGHTSLKPNATSNTRFLKPESPKMKNFCVRKDFTTGTQLTICKP